MNEPSEETPGLSPVRFVTLDELAERWQCSRRLVETYVADGRLRSVKLGPRLIRIHPADVEAFEAAAVRGGVA